MGSNIGNYNKHKSYIVCFYLFFSPSLSLPVPLFAAPGPISFWLVDVTPPNCAARGDTIDNKNSQPPALAQTPMCLLGLGKDNLHQLTRLARSVPMRCEIDWMESRWKHTFSKTTRTKRSLALHPKLFFLQSINFPLDLKAQSPLANMISRPDIILVMVMREYTREVFSPWSVTAVNKGTEQWRQTRSKDCSWSMASCFCFSSTYIIVSY